MRMLMGMDIPRVRVVVVLMRLGLGMGMGMGMAIVLVVQMVMDIGMAMVMRMGIGMSEVHSNAGRSDRRLSTISTSQRRCKFQTTLSLELAGWLCQPRISISNVHKVSLTHA